MRLFHSINTFWHWLLAPPEGKRPKNAPLKYRKPHMMRYEKPLYYEASVTTADRLFSKDPPAPHIWMIVHVWWFEWQGRLYRVELPDMPPKFSFKPGQAFPCWICPTNLKKVWALDQENNCRKWHKDDGDPDKLPRHPQVDSS